MKPITNIGEDKLINHLTSYFKPNDSIYIMSQKFSIYGFYALKKELSKIKEAELLLEDLDHINGLDTEVQFKSKLMQKRIAKDCLSWVKSKVKCYKYTDNTSETDIFLKDSDYKYAINANIRNFSTELLGEIKSDKRIRIRPETENFYNLNEFMNIKNTESTEITKDLMDSLTKLSEDKSLEELYYQTLHSLFNKILASNNQDTIIKLGTGFQDSIIWKKLYNFQQDGVLGAIHKLETYNGCIIADSVGLGKTFEALAVIKYYESRNLRVLVLCPKKLRDNWTIYRANDKRNLVNKDNLRYDVLNHTDLTRSSGKSGDIELQSLNWGNYDLVVIDESHNFRNNTPSKKEKKTRYQKLMEDIIKQGVNTKVLMLSATPVNNKMSDLKNQISFITKDNDDAFAEDHIKSIKNLTKQAQREFNQWIKSEHKENLLNVLPDEYFVLLDMITIARSRKHIEKYYNDQDIGKFPERLTPKNIKSPIADPNKFPTLKEVAEKLSQLNLAIYSPMAYIKMEKRAEYEKKYDTITSHGITLKQLSRENNLIHLMRVNMLKRLESSICAFQLTIDSLHNKIEDVLTQINNNQETTELNINTIDQESKDLENELLGNKVKVLIKDIDKPKLEPKLKEDLKILSDLFYNVEISIEDDLKLNKLKNLIDEKISKPINPHNKKVIIFTAFADTAKYLYDNISLYVKEKYDLNTALVTGGSVQNKTNANVKNMDLNSILTNFSPMSKERDKQAINNIDDIDILIATDCISEGQNLQDCDFLINYDIHWNPVRIIQRFGRIDRIGSINNRIQLVNFWADMDLDEYIKLESKVKGRFKLLNITATGEEDVISENDQMNDLNYRRKQLEQLQEKVIDLEEMENGISITDLTLSNYKMDIETHIKSKPLTTTTGFYATTLCEEHQSGVIFCLKSLTNKHEVYALHPYYLVYVANDGTILHDHTKLKATLDILKDISYNQNKVDLQAEENLNKATKDGLNMSAYSSLLEKAVNSILNKVEETKIESLFTMGETSILEEHQTEFDVVNYVIIQSKNQN